VLFFYFVPDTTHQNDLAMRIIAVSGLSANPLVAFYVTHGREGLFLCSVSDTIHLKFGYAINIDENLDSFKYFFKPDRRINRP
jgi:hypothetical protein